MNFRRYVEGSKISLFTNHKALIYLNNQPKLNTKQARWISFINLFDYSIKYKEGALNKVADGLSRQFSKDSLEEKKPERLRIDFNLNYLEEKVPVQLARARLRIQTLCAIEISSIESTLIEEIKKAQQLDEQCMRVLNNKINKDDRHLKLLDGIVMQNNKYYIPN